jgi:hypothetical protein
MSPAGALLGASNARIVQLLMNTMLLRLFQRQVAMQCEIVPASAGALNPPFGDQTWHAIQSLLTATANLSKLFWGQAGRKTDERKRLRDSLLVGDTSVLQPTRFRNHFDHFDERLDLTRQS